MNAQFPHHALQNLLTANKRRKSESVDVPSISHSPRHEDMHHPQHHHPRSSHNNNQIKNEYSPKYENNEVDETKIKREPAGAASNASDQNENEIDFHSHEFKMLGSSKKTMNDVLKLLTTKMRGSTLREGRKDSTEEFDGKT